MGFRTSISASYVRVWEVVRRIPKGRVSTYGEVARLAGFGRHARLAGYALHALPPGTDIPWHRVINARGRLSFPPRSASHRRQKQLLVKEGIRFSGENVDLKRYGWRPGRSKPPTAGTSR